MISVPASSPHAPQIQTTMREFYKKALLGFLWLLAINVVIGYICIDQSYLRAALLPAQDSPIPWRALPDTDVKEGGQSAAQTQSDAQRLRFNFTISPHLAHPYAAAELIFLDRKGKPVHADLSRYTAISFLAKCSPANTLTLRFPIFDRSISRRDDLLSYRTPAAFFSCNSNWGRVELDLTRLETPQWWFDMFKLDISHQAYKLDAVPKISFGNTFQTPHSINSTLEIGELVLQGRDYRYLILFGAFLAITCTGFGIWFFRKHTRALIDDVKDKLQKDLPFVAYQQLSLEPHRDKEKTAILRLIATSYANPDLDLDSVVAETGVNRNKINDILKTELGFTFSGYLNKLRLTEAARLLAEKDTATVAEIAY